MWSVAVNCPSSPFRQGHERVDDRAADHERRRAKHLVAEPLVGHEILRIGGEQRARPLASRPRPPDRAGFDPIVLREGLNHRSCECQCQHRLGSQALSAVAAAPRNRSRSEPSSPKTSPGLVQNCLAPIEREATNSRQIVFARAVKRAASARRRCSRRNGSRRR
jgi:hypothetical protein